MITYLDCGGVQWDVDRKRVETVVHGDVYTPRVTSAHENEHQLSGNARTLSQRFENGDRSSGVDRERGRKKQSTGLGIKSLVCIRLDLSEGT